MIMMTDEALAEAAGRPCIPRATRFEPTRSDAFLAWREPVPGREPGSNLPGTSADPEAERDFALLLDISQTGASVALDKVPSPKEGVWLKLGGDRPEDWTQAEVVGVTTTALGPHLVRLAFRAPCPLETLIGTICG